LAQALQNGKTQLFSRDVTTEETHGLLHAGYERHDRLFFDRAVLAGALNTTDYFLSIERLTVSGTLHDGESNFFDSFKCGESLIARRTFPSATDSDAIFGQSRVDHAIVISRAKGASHKAKLA